MSCCFGGKCSKNDTNFSIPLYTYVTVDLYFCIKLRISRASLYLVVSFLFVSLCKLQMQLCSILAHIYSLFSLWNDFFFSVT
jgi:hypothetical protein